MTRVLDLSSRLPGPLATKLLGERGLDVIKFEKEKGDPFTRTIGSDDKTFSIWYDNINEKKKIIRDDDKNRLQKEIEASQVILWDRPHDEIDLPEGPRLFVTLASGWESPMHDLNALADLGLLDHVQNLTPPPFPVAGIVFAHQIAIDILSLLPKTVEQKKSIFHTCTLKKSLESGMSFLMPELHGSTNTFLHTGRYACYHIYQLADGKRAALAAVETRFWQNFCQCFDLPYGEEDRFNSPDSKIGRELHKKFAGWKSDEVKRKMTKECCLTLF